MSNMIVKNGLILAVFAMLTTGLIALTHMGTQDQITYQQQQKLLDTLSAVVPAHLHNNEMPFNCVTVESPELLGSEMPQTVYRAFLNGQPSAVAMETVAPDGYSGNIHLIVGITGEGTVTGVRVLAHQETPGLGDKIDLRVSDWIQSFDNREVQQDTLDSWAVRKDGGSFDQFTGATITPRAVVSAVKDAVLFYQQQHDMLFRARNQCTTEQLQG